MFPQTSASSVYSPKQDVLWTRLLTFSGICLVPRAGRPGGYADIGRPSTDGSISFQAPLLRWHTSPFRSRFFTLSENQKIRFHFKKYSGSLSCSFYRVALRMFLMRSCSGTPHTVFQQLFCALPLSFRGWLFLDSSKLYLQPYNLNLPKYWKTLSPQEHRNWKNPISVCVN